MPSKLVGYALLSFLSFCFFTVVFNAIAIVQVSAQQPTPAPNPGNVVPTPTIYNAQAEITTPQKTQSIISTPTPTVSVKQTSILKEQSVAVEPTDTPVPPTETPTPTVLPTATPTPSPEPTTTTTTTDPETLFSKYSAQYSVSKDELEKIATCESGERADAQSPNGDYLGMFQFAAISWSSTRTAMGLDPNPGLRTNAEEAIRTAAFMLSRGEQNAWPNCN